MMRKLVYAVVLVACTAFADDPVCTINPVPICTATPTPTPTNTPTDTPTPTNTPTDTPTPTNTPTFTPTPVPTLIPENLTLLGSFWVPGGDSHAPLCNQQAYSLGTIAYQASDNTIYATSHGQDPMCVAKFSVPSDLSGAVKATVLAQPWGRIPRDSRYPNANQMRVRGLLWDESHNRLCFTEHIWYNVTNSDALDAGCLHADGTVDGLWELGFNNRIAGPMTMEADGHHALIGLTTAQGVAVSNLGPGAYEIDLNNPISAVPLLTHDTNHREQMSGISPVDSHWPPNVWMDGLESMGSAIIDGTLVRSVEEGDHYFYGLGSNFQSAYGFAPRGMGQGYHHDHYSSVLYFYALADLERVRLGQMMSTDVHPYAYKHLPLPAEPVGLGGLAVDLVGHRLFLASQQRDKGVKVYVYTW